MYKTRITAVLGSVAILAVTACAASAHQAGSAHLAAASAHPAHSTAPVVEVTDANGLVCPAMDSLGYCPGDDPTPSPTAATCGDQIDNWKANGASSQVSALGQDIGQYGAAVSAVAADISAGTDPSTDEATAQTALAALQGDIQAAGSNPAPECVPGLRQDYNAALSDLTASVTDGDNGLTLAASGDYNGATIDLDASNTALNKATAKIAAAVTDIQNYNNS